MFIWTIWRKWIFKEYIVKTGHRTSCTLQSQKTQLQEDRCNSEVVLARRGIETNTNILNSHTDLILSLTTIASNAATQQNTQDLKDLMLKILKSNLQVYELMLNMHTNLPHQIARQQPLMFLDACGRLSPVHLEFITSAEAFLAVLKVRFKHLGVRKIERGQFVLEEARTKRTIDLRRPWETCFLPGQRIEMSMVFSQIETSKSTCPSCQWEVIADPAKAIQW